MRRAEGFNDLDLGFTLTSNNPDVYGLIYIYIHIHTYIHTCIHTMYIIYSPPTNKVGSFLVTGRVLRFYGLGHQGLGVMLGPLLGSYFVRVP